MNCRQILRPERERERSCERGSLRFDAAVTELHVYVFGSITVKHYISVCGGHYCIVIQYFGT